MSRNRSTEVRNVSLDRNLYVFSMETRSEYFRSVSLTSVSGESIQLRNNATLGYRDIAVKSGDITRMPCWLAMDIRAEILKVMLESRTPGLPANTREKNAAIVRRNKKYLQAEEHKDFIEHLARARKKERRIEAIKSLDRIEENIRFLARRRNVDEIRRRIRDIDNQHHRWNRWYEEGP